jgi:hypothetical protein
MSNQQRMTPERFKRIEELYHAARERTAEDRAALLAQIDPALRREVESGSRIRCRLCLGLFARISRSDALAGDLEKRFPEDTFVNFDYAPVLRALSVLGRGKPTDSLERLQIALPYEVAADGLNFNHFYLGGLHSAYVRGN